MSNVFATYCECRGDIGHEPGCLLNLQLKIKYGDAKRGIKGIAELSGAVGWIEPEAVESIDRWVAHLAKMWVDEDRMCLKKEECGWIDGWRAIPK